MSLQLAWAKWHFWTFTSFLFFSLQEMFYICGIIQESMSGAILMGEFILLNFKNATFFPELSSTPSLIHATSGGGFPEASHAMVTGDPSM